MDREIQNILNEHTKVINKHAAQLLALSAIIASIPDSCKLDLSEIEKRIDQMTVVLPFGVGTLPNEAKGHCRAILKDRPKSP